MLCLQRNVVVYFSTHVCIMKLMCNDHKRCTSLKKITWTIICTKTLTLHFYYEAQKWFSLLTKQRSLHKAFIIEQDYSKVIWNWIIYKHLCALLQTLVIQKAVSDYVINTNRTVSAFFFKPQSQYHRFFLLISYHTNVLNKCSLSTL